MMEPIAELDDDEEGFDFNSSMVDGRNLQMHFRSRSNTWPQFSSAAYDDPDPDSIAIIDHHIHHPHHSHHNHHHHHDDTHELLVATRNKLDGTLNEHHIGPESSNAMGSIVGYPLLYDQSSSSYHTPAEKSGLMSQHQHHSQHQQQQHHHSDGSNLLDVADLYGNIHSHHNNLLVPVSGSSHSQHQQQQHHQSEIHRSTSSSPATAVVAAAASGASGPSSTSMHSQNNGGSSKIPSGVSSTYFSSSTNSSSTTTSTNSTIRASTIGIGHTPMDNVDSTPSSVMNANNINNTNKSNNSSNSNLNSTSQQQQQQQQHLNTFSSRNDEMDRVGSPSISSPVPSTPTPSHTPTSTVGGNPASAVAAALAAASALKKNTSRRNAWGNMSYADLITQAINGSPEKRLTLSQIYEWMVQNVTYFKDKGDSNSSAGWKNSIRHNLSLHNRFMRVQNEGTGKSSWWMINPDAKPGKAARRRAISMETHNYEKRRGRVKRRVEQLRAAAGLMPLVNDPGALSALSDSYKLASSSTSLTSLCMADTSGSGTSSAILVSSPSSSDNYDPFMDSSSHFHANQSQFSPGEFRPRASSNASSTCSTMNLLLDNSDNRQVSSLSPHGWSTADLCQLYNTTPSSGGSGGTYGSTSLEQGSIGTYGCSTNNSSGSNSNANNSDAIQLQLIDCLANLGTGSSSSSSNAGGNNGGANNNGAGTGNGATGGGGGGAGGGNGGGQSSTTSSSSSNNYHPMMIDDDEQNLSSIRNKCNSLVSVPVTATSGNDQQQQQQQQQGNDATTNDTMMLLGGVDRTPNTSSTTSYNNQQHDLYKLQSQTQQQQQQQQQHSSSSSISPSTTTTPPLNGSKSHFTSLENVPIMIGTTIGTGKANSLLNSGYYTVEKAKLTEINNNNQNNTGSIALAAGANLNLSLGSIPYVSNNSSYHDSQSHHHHHHHHNHHNHHRSSSTSSVAAAAAAAASMANTDLSITSSSSYSSPHGTSMEHGFGKMTLGFGLYAQDPAQVSCYGTVYNDSSFTYYGDYSGVSHEALNSLSYPSHVTGPDLDLDFDTVCTQTGMLECDVDQVIKHELSVDGSIDLWHASANVDPTNTVSCTDSSPTNTIKTKTNTMKSITNITESNTNTNSHSQSTSMMHTIDESMPCADDHYQRQHHHHHMGNDDVDVDKYNIMQPGGNEHYHHQHQQQQQQQQHQNHSHDASIINLNHNHHHHLNRSSQYGPICTTDLSMDGSMTMSINSSSSNSSSNNNMPNTSSVTVNSAHHHQTTVTSRSWVH